MKQQNKAKLPQMNIDEGDRHNLNIPIPLYREFAFC